ncbi:alpha-1,3-mannosyl-glycoprotein 4-beta-N-acetylglucosaminyltransferase C-like [Stylophora pistillata]|uniref:alpha-1,3-mannosyl-glycoprotein 4-beta-N-acetylglucosaminyltransferase C-like n=1 Tax=Stylophora pistillata TaxID=50429 RepID=UPI000C03936D|nr:alpha-1,3-mannosyl-glycoprotein 4-beta-N-acetylglucosaminyltransferase C-like [Stylophora pistillata]
MWKQHLFTVFLYGVIIFNAAMVVLKHIYYRSSSSLLTCDGSDSILGIPAEQCPLKALSSYCTKRVLDGVNIRQGLVLGKERKQKVFLTVGIVGTKGEESNLLQALYSLTKHISTEEHVDIVFAVVFEGDSNSLLLQRIKSEFEQELDKGLIQVLHPTREFYEAVNIEPAGWGDLTVTEALKNNTMAFNKRLCFLLEYCFRSSKHCLLLTDQARALKPYLPVIKEVVNKIEEKNLTFYAHDFGERSLPSLGRLYSEALVGDLADYAALFPGGRLPQSIVNVFANLRMSCPLTSQEGGQFLFKMAIEPRGSKPRAEFETTIKCEGGHEIEKAFIHESFAWLQTPKKDDKVIVKFVSPFKISRVLVATGSPFYSDMMINSELSLCANNMETNTCDESQCKVVASFTDPVLDVRNLETVVNFFVKCLKIHFIADVKRWVMIREISVWSRVYE